MGGGVTALQYHDILKSEIQTSLGSVPSGLRDHPGTVQKMVYQQGTMSVELDRKSNVDMADKVL